MRTAFNLTVDEAQHLFVNVREIASSDYLKRTLTEYLPLANAINMEKARSELLIAPILLEVRRIFNGEIGFFSGTEFEVDPELGLNGFCDYILTASRELYEIRSPVVTLVEAKNENIKSGLGQCIAEMIAAQRFNQRDALELSTIYGAVTTGAIWKFLKLLGQTAFIDLDDYYITSYEKIIGILCQPFLSHSASI
ncbi:hypothetical protein [Phormidium sp. CCY1219]|jgi:hypothetical protein|uniref:hypothetical protein n=1 Tax=Phormidium sp. CCY1219 TaxID=2886104 RepID=UPI002D1E8F18|nr:hypothetical protein [Phormidium sp. CCY1219]MEB3831207.1 hypothetical protein [Phormidium sp. CCY1219]